MNLLTCRARVNRLKDLGLNKGLEQLPALREKLIAVTDGLAGVEADLLNVHVDFPLFERLARPVAAGRTKMPGIKIHDTRMLRPRSRRGAGAAHAADGRFAGLRSRVFRSKRPRAGGRSNFRPALGVVLRFAITLKAERHQRGAGRGRTFQSPNASSRFANW